MNPVSPDRNAFEALFTIAAEERWCWSIFCTTCGHMHFRYALHELQLGKHPDSPSWVVRQSHPVLKRGGQPKELGPLPPLGSWPLAEQRELINVLSAANLEKLASSCPFPDWLGYLGLALLYTEDAERDGHALSRAWAPQLIALLPRGSSASEVLERIASSHTRTLSWRDLEAVGSDFQNVRSWQQ